MIMISSAEICSYIGPRLFFFNFIEQHTYLEPMINHWIFYWNPLYFIGKGHLKLKTVLVGFCLSIFLGAAILHWTPRYFWENNTFFDWCLAGNLREWSIITSNNHPSNPQQPIHSLQNTSKLNMVKKTLPLVDDVIIMGHHFPVIRH
jgi:hypothetical protein